MSQKNRFSPPALAEKMLGIIYSDKGQFTHLGDFEEMFLYICENKGKGYARIWYWLHIIKSLPGFIKNKLYWSTAMLKNYILIAVRNVIKNKGFSFINVTGLAVGMACFLLIMVYVQHETSYDRFPAFRTFPCEIHERAFHIRKPEWEVKEHPYGFSICGFSDPDHLHRGCVQTDGFHKNKEAWV